VGAEGFGYLHHAEKMKKHALSVPELVKTGREVDGKWIEMR
jgi:hypothetical protein